MRYTLILFTLFCSKTIFAQLALGYNQTYTYKKTDGFLNENYGIVLQTSNGKIYSSGYATNVLNIIGNNYYKQLKFIGGIALTTFFEIDSNSILFATTDNLYVVKDDTVYKKFPFANTIEITKIDAKKFIVTKGNASKWEIYNFDTEKLDFISELEMLKVNIPHYIYHNKDTLLFIQDFVEIKLNLKNKNFTSVDNNGYCASIGSAYNVFIKNKKYYQINNGSYKEIPNAFYNSNLQKNELINFELSFGNQFLQKSTPSSFTILDKATLQPSAFFESNDKLQNANKISNGNYLVGAGNMPLRVFDYIKKYPKIYNDVDASNIFSVVQHTNGAIWAGSYKKDLAIIDGYKKKQVPLNKFQFMNGGISINNKMYLIGESGNGGLLCIKENGSYEKLKKNVSGFCTFITKNYNNFYFGSASYNGLYNKKVNVLNNTNVPWQIIDSTKGINLKNILSITEDTLGRIWCSHPSTGVGIYNPQTNKGQTFLKKNSESQFGFMSSTIDKKGTLWFGGIKGDGLWYYNDYTKPATPLNCKQLLHPLLQSKNYISAVTLYKDWLVMAVYDKILVLDLNTFYKEHKTKIYYLTSQETNFTAPTEQNSMLTSFTDSTIWFSTSDMLYQWDIKKWLTLPKYKVSNKVFIATDSTQVQLFTNQPFYVAPTANSFTINIEYLSPDGLPRYTSAMLIKNGDSTKLPEPNLQSIFTLKNLSSGSYTFIEEIYEQDGTTSHYEYKIIVKKFLWQQWWFWLGIALLCISIISYFIYLKKKKQLAEQTAKTKDAELETVKAEQAKKIANLQLVTLSSQFRPHFILNALNTIGAQMDDKPDAESVLSRLGESINLIFSHAQQQKIVHSFANEWLLVQNIIHIHRLMYLKNLQTETPTDDVLKKYNAINVPLGILQIPIENALLHGLSNKEAAPWLLKIKIEEDANYITINITDNGVGRKKSATLSNFTKHGTGTKNLTEIINIINSSNEHEINVAYKDDVFTENEITYGTTVIITLPKLLHYANQ